MGQEVAVGEVRGRVERFVQRIRERDPELRAVIRLLDDRALRVAGRLDADPAARGPLRGLTMGVKDNIDIEGVPSTAGSAHLGSAPARADATAARLLAEAGSVVLAKNNMAEFAMGVTGRNASFGDCRNALDPARISGGSSSGSAVAVAAGMVDAALGTDTGGSGRIPASVNGVVGVRPTQGRVSNRGVLPVSATFDTVTPIAADVRTAVAVLAVLDWWDIGDATSVEGSRPPVDALLDAGLDGLRVGVGSGFFETGVDPGVRTVVQAAVDVLRAHGAQVRTVQVPGAADAQDHMLDIMYPEAAAAHAERIRRAPQTIDSDVLRRLRIGALVPAERIERARQWRQDFRRRVDQLFGSVDVVATPTMPIDVPLRDGVDLAASTRQIARFTYVWAMYGGPSISLPCGVHPGSGMPVGLQLAAAPWHEDMLLRAAAGYERVAGTAAARR
jgi:aspartyl-tRNA(Asn)/glutamyl-tRNA(Gln) amidotransferase subunit A